MNYIFFDVDGVLNGTDENGNWIDEEIQVEKVNNLINLAKSTNSKLIMSSTWRTAWNDKGELVKTRKHNILLDELLRNADCALYSVTPIIEYNRNKEIKQWLALHAKADDRFICLDDEYGYYVNDEFFNDKFMHTAPSHCNGFYHANDVVGLFTYHVTDGKKLMMAQ